MKTTAIGGGVYERDDGTFWIRPTVSGSRTWRKLAATTKRYAKAEAAEINGDRTKAERNEKTDPLAKEQSATLRDWFATYLKNEMPTKNLEPRTPKQIATESGNLVRVLEFFGDRTLSDIKVKDCPKYREWRLEHIKLGTGNRTVDLELTSLSNLLNWAVTAGHTDYNFIGHNRPRYQRKKDITHCRERAPESADELHKLALELFSAPQSEVLGWQLLLEAFTGCRTSEILRLQMDASSTDEPGYIEGNYLFLKRSKNGINPFALIHPALGQVIRAHHQWHRNRYPGGNPSWLPGRSSSQGVSKCALTHALRRITRNLGIDHRTSHGLRSFYVTVRRSQGATDGQIAAEIGQSSGEKLIREVYGECPPNWQGRTAMDWLPTSGAPAWAEWIPLPDTTQQPQFKIA